MKTGNQYGLLDFISIFHNEEPFISNAKLFRYFNKFLF